MEDLNYKFDSILQTKTQELQEILKTKTRKMTKEVEKDVVNYSVKTTLAKINAEQDRKLKASKAYKKIQQYTCDIQSNNQEIKNELIHV